MLIPNTYLLAAYRFQITGDPEEMLVTLGHEGDSFIGPSMANALQDAFADTMMAPLMGLGVTFTGVRCQHGTNAAGTGPYVVEDSTNAPVVSGGTSELVPQNTAFLVRKQTETPGRRGRGRMYFPGTITEATTSSIGVITGAALATRQTALNAWHARLVTDQLAPVLLHQAGDPTPSPITAFLGQQVVATQRRRLRR